MADASPVRLPAPGSAQRVALRVLLAGAIAALLEPAGLRLQPEVPPPAGWLHDYVGHAAVWSLFAASIPLVARACEATRGAWRAAVAVLCGAYLAPIGCLIGAGLIVDLARGEPGGPSVWTTSARSLVVLAAHWPPRVTWYFGHPAAYLAVYLLESGVTPRVPAPVVAVVAFVVQAIAYVVFCMAMYGQRDVVRYFAWSAALREAAWPALAALSAGLATWLEARLALWLTARREEAARRG